MAKYDTSFDFGANATRRPRFSGASAFRKGRHKVGGDAPAKARKHAARFAKKGGGS